MLSDFPVLAGFAKDQLYNQNNDKGHDRSIGPMDSFSFDDHFIFRSKFKKPIKKNTETLLQISTFINDTDVANNIDPIEKKYHERIVICILSHH